MYPRLRLTTKKITILASVLVFFLLTSVVLYFLNKTTISVTTDPQKAVVYVDTSSEPVGQSPLEITGVKRNVKYTITARKEGYLDTFTEILTAEAKQSVRFQLIKPITISPVVPEQNARDVDINTKIAATFVAGFPQEQVQFIFNPALEGLTEFDSTTSTVVFTPSQPLPRDTKYGVRLVIKKGVNTTILKTWSFVSKQFFGEEAFDEKGLGQLRVARDQAIKAYDERKKRIPFLTKLPFTSAGHFKVEITASSDTIFITLPGNVEAYKDEALAWIRANGGDPNKLTIEYRFGGL